MAAGQDVVDRERDRAREYQGSFGGNFGGSGTLIEQRLNEIQQRLNEIRTMPFTSPTARELAREVCQHTASVLETAWLIERQGGVTMSSGTESGSYRTQPR